MNIITEKITFGGKSIGKIDGKNVFIPYAIPGETLDINITESKRDYDNAEIVSIVRASEYRVEPECKYYGKCGGCNMMHIEESYQRVLRTQMLEDIFSQNGIDVAGRINVVYGPGKNYRARFQLNNGGLSERSSNITVPVSECICAEKIINEYLKITPVEIRPQGRIHLFGSKYADNELKIAYNENAEKRNAPVKLKGGKKIKVKENHHFAGTIISPEYTIAVNINGKKLTFDIRGFFQSNLYVFEKVTQLILDNLPGGENILDMYAGCGSISTFLTEKYKNVVLVEHNRDALVYAEQNLSGTTHLSYGLSGAAWVKNCSQFAGKFDACVVDPPRSGMEKEVREYLCKSKIPYIISLSCDPATHARDCAALIKAGYILKRIYLLDFYPNTSHIESLSVFELQI